MRTIHIDPAGHVKRCPDFPTDFHWRDFKRVRADRLQRVLLRVPRRGAGAAAPLARARRDGPARADGVSDDAAVRQRARRSSPAPARRARGAAREMRDAGVRTASPCRARTGASRRRAAATSCGARYPGRRASSTAAAACSRPASSTRTRMRSSAARATRSRSCARRACRTWRSRARGGGIHASVRDLRGRDRGRAVRARAAAARARSPRHGATTVEVKSGYGLTLDDELKTLRVIRRLAEALPMRIVPTWLGAHEIPLEYRERAGGAARVHRAARPRDAAGGRRARGSPASPTSSASRASTRSTRSREILTAARAAGLGIKLHADELTTSAAARSSPATLGAHVGRPPRRGQRRRASRRSPPRGTVATLLPGTMLFLGKRDQAPARRADRGRRSGRARDRLQSGHVADRRTFRSC